MDFVLRGSETHFAAVLAGFFSACCLCVANTALQLVISAVDSAGHVVNSTLNLAVEDVNEAPIVADQSFALDVGVPLRVSLVARDPDSAMKPLFSTLAYEVLSTNDTNQRFTLQRATGVFTSSALNLDAGGDATLNAFYFLVSAAKCFAVGCLRCALALGSP